MAKLKRKTSKPARARKQESKQERKQESRIKRIQTGIPGLDELIEGGIPDGTINLLSGDAGTGKSIFAMQFLVHGADKGDPGVYISLEKDPEDILENMSRFDWKLEEHIKNKRIIVIKPEIVKFDVLKKVIEDQVDRTSAKRLVISPFSLLSAYFANVYDDRKALADLGRLMKKLHCTSIVVTDIVEGDQGATAADYEEFVANGVFVLKLGVKQDSGSYVRSLFIKKMDSTRHSLKLSPVEIKEKGIVVYPEAEVF